MADKRALKTRENDITCRFITVVHDMQTPMEKELHLFQCSVINVEASTDETQVIYVNTQFHKRAN